MKFNYILLLSAAALAVSAAETNTSAEDCVKTKNCGTDVNCIAECFGVPHPTEGQVSKAETCITNCKTDENCYLNCINTEFMGNGSQSNQGQSGQTGTDANTDKPAASNNKTDAKAPSADSTDNGAPSRAAVSSLIGVVFSALYFLL